MLYSAICCNAKGQFLYIAAMVIFLGDGMSFKNIPVSHVHNSFAGTK